jgi:hypothetical protein
MSIVEKIKGLDNPLLSCALPDKLSYPKYLCECQRLYLNSLHIWSRGSGKNTQFVRDNPEYNLRTPMISPTIDANSESVLCPLVRRVPKNQSGRSATWVETWQPVCMHPNLFEPLYYYFVFPRFKLHLQSWGSWTIRGSSWSRVVSWCDDWRLVFWLCDDDCLEHLSF